MRTKAPTKNDAGRKRKKSPLQLFRAAIRRARFAQLLKRCFEAWQDAWINSEGVQYGSMQAQYDTMSGTVWCAVFRCSMQYAGSSMQYSGSMQQYAAVCSSSMQQQYAVCSSSMYHSWCAV